MSVRNVMASVPEEDWPKVLSAAVAEGVAPGVFIGRAACAAVSGGGSPAGGGGRAVQKRMRGRRVSARPGGLGVAARAVADCTGVPVSSIMGPSRERFICRARFMLVALLRWKMSMSHASVAEWMKLGDHSTAHYCGRRHIEMLDVDDEYRDCWGRVVERWQLYVDREGKGVSDGV